MMNLKKMLNIVFSLLGQPAIAWRGISHCENRAPMFNTFLYPLIMLCCLSSFVGTLLTLDFGFESFYYASIKMGVVFATLFFSFYLSSFLVARFSAVYMKAEYDRLLTDLLTGYSMVVVLLLELCLNLFPNFRIICWILQFYTVKIVWDGAAVLMRIPEERRLSFTMVVSLVLIITPVMIGSMMSMLSASFG